jgi:phosphoribosylamine--glycine ligase
VGQELTLIAEWPYLSISRNEPIVKILLIGNGGREHAIVWKLKQSSLVEKVWCAPGNGGISFDCDCVPLNLQDVNSAANLATRLVADLTIVGPELPLVNGIADEFLKRGLLLLGPSKAAAQLEGSKVFAKQFMERNGIPTAETYGIFDSAIDAHTALDSVEWPLVIKADGLAAGKGVLVATHATEAAAFIERVMEKKEFGAAGEKVLFEKALVGKELSYIILTDGRNFMSMAPTRDHKRVFDRDQGPNTGGMGTYSTDKILTAELEQEILKTIVQPTLAALEKEKLGYRGFIFFGLMLTADGPKVLEYNCRLGDPETQSILMRADFDFAKACFDAAKGKLDASAAKWKPGASICVVVASEGYPGDPVVGKKIEGLAEAQDTPGVAIFQAGTRREDDGLYTSSGRILGVCAIEDSLGFAAVRVYGAVDKLKIDGAHYRKDVGAAAMKTAFDTLRNVTSGTSYG